MKSLDLFRETLSRGGRKYSGKKETSDAPRDQRYQSLLCKPNKRDHDYNEKDQKEELEKERNRGKNKVGNSGKDFPEKPEREKEDLQKGHLSGTFLTESRTKTSHLLDCNTLDILPFVCVDADDLSRLYKLWDKNFHPIFECGGLHCTLLLTSNPSHSGRDL